MEPTRILFIVVAIFVFGIGNSIAQEDQTPIPVTVKYEADSWKLFRAGKPYYVKGAGGLGSLQLLKKYGGNSTRLWGVGETTMQRLDEAHRHGLSVAVGIWLEHETRGYDYQDYDQVKDQIAKVLDAVEKFKDHPAVLVWGVGNEMEGYESGDNPAIWHHVEHLCRKIKDIDPNHPTMTVVAEIGGNRIPAIHEFCPSVDIIGINSYGGAASLPKRYRDAGGSKPYIVTEFGPFGPWESSRDSINAVAEPYSQVKAEKYKESYLGFNSDESLCLGSYAFLWGQKMEATTTWFGMLLADGRATNMVDVMSELWTGKRPQNRAPIIESLTNSTGSEIDGEEMLDFELRSIDPDGDPVSVEWQLLPEADAYLTYGDFKPNPNPLENAVVESSSKHAQIRAPQKSGLYRLYAIVDDGKGSVATANIAFKVRYRPLDTPGQKKELPSTIYDDSEKQTDFPVIRAFGDVANAELELNCLTQPQSGKSCIRWIVDSGSDATGVSLIATTGIDVMGAKRISFWAKGTNGNERIAVGVGGGKTTAGHTDTFAKQKSIPLTKYWKKFHIDFANADMRRISTGFYWSNVEQGQPIEIFLDNIQFE